MYAGVYLHLSTFFVLAVKLAVKLYIAVTTCLIIVAFTNVVLLSPVYVYFLVAVVDLFGWADRGDGGACSGAGEIFAEKRFEDGVVGDVGGPTLGGVDSAV